MSVSLEEQIAAVERCADDFRWARSRPDVVEYKTYHAMRALAKELTERRQRSPGDVIAALQRRINDAHASNVGGRGFDRRVLAGVGEELIGRWPKVREALESAERARGERK